MHSFKYFWMYQRARSNIVGMFAATSILIVSHVIINALVVSFSDLCVFADYFTLHLPHRDLCQGMCDHDRSAIAIKPHVISWHSLFCRNAMGNCRKIWGFRRCIVMHSNHPVHTCMHVVCMCGVLHLQTSYFAAFGWATFVGLLEHLMLVQHIHWIISGVTSGLLLAELGIEIMLVLFIKIIDGRVFLVEESFFADKFLLKILSNHFVLKIKRLISNALVQGLAWLDEVLC